MSTHILSIFYRTLCNKTMFTTGKYKLTLKPVIQLPSLTIVKESSTSTKILNTSISTYDITKTIKYISKDNKRLKFDQQTLKLTHPTGKPLCVLIAWMNADNKHVDKYIKIYLEQDFDVLTVATTTLHTLWPRNGNQVIAANLVKFLHSNDSVAPLMLHGFSAGACLWGEVSHIIASDRQKYQPIADRIIFQVWDSIIDYETSQLSIPLAVFPKSILLQRIASVYAKLHVLIFYKNYTLFMQRACSEFYNVSCPAPALFFVSSTDRLGLESTSRMVSEKWKSLGIKVTLKCWKKSPHVQHFMKHPKEYLTLLYNHMDQVGLLKENEKAMAKLNSM